MKLIKYVAPAKTAIVGLFALFTYGNVYAQSIPPMDSPPSVSRGVTIEPLENHQVPDILKNQARQEIEQMKTRGYVDVPEDAVSYLDRAKEDKDKILKPWKDARTHLKVVPATVHGTSLEESGVEVLGAMPSGNNTAEGWTGVSRLFVAPKLGLMMLEELDYIASGGGLKMIKESINLDIDGRPAIFRIKTAQKGKSITELTWTTERKIYTLSANRVIKGDALQAMLDFARNLQD